MKKILAGVSAMTFVFGVFAGDISQVVAIAPLVLSPSSPNVPTYTSIPSGAVSVPYNFTFGISGGVGVDTWHIYIGGNAGGPPGLALSSSGELQGTPTTAGNYTIEIQVTDQSEDITTDFYNLTINPAIHPTGISITNPTSTMTVGQTYQLVAAITPSNVTNQNVAWSSSDPDILVVGNGSLTPVSAGTATITATTVDGGFMTTDSVTINTITNSISVPPTSGSCLPRATSFPYTIVDFGPGSANGINNSGQVVGENASGDAFLYSSGTIENFAAGTASAINNLGQAAGTDAAGDAFIYTSGTLRNIGIATAYAINDLGEVVGQTGNGAFLYSSGTMQDIAVPDGFDFNSSVAYGINNLGQVVGTEQGHIAEGFLYASGTLEDAGGAINYGINDNGEIVGKAVTCAGGGCFEAFSSVGSSSLFLGDNNGSESSALAVNNLGQIVGFDATGAYLYFTSTGSVENLNSFIDPSSGWNLQQANGINDAGEIVGYGTNASGRTDAFLLIPNNLCPPTSVVTILTTSLASGTAGVAYDQFVAATSTTPDDVLSWNITGLPSGLAYNSSTGEISGAPLVTSTDILAVTVKDANPSSTPADANFTLSIGVPISTSTSTPTSTPPTRFTITASAEPGGTISPSGTVLVASGSDQTFMIAALPGFDLGGKVVDGVNVGGQIVGSDSYTFTDVIASHTIVADFFPSELATVTVTPATSTLPIGATKQLTATPRDQAGLPFPTGVTWLSSNSGIAKVSSSGLVTAVASGTVSITAASGTPATVTLISAIVTVLAPTSTPPVASSTPTSTPRAQKLNILAAMTAYQKMLSNKQDKNNLNEAVICLNNSLNAKWWIDNAHVVHATGKGGEVFYNEECSALYLGKLISNPHGAVSTSTLQGFVNGLVADDRLLAVTAINEAVASSGRASYIANANGEITTADNFAKKGNDVAAIDNYEPAWEWALRSLNELSR